TGHERDRNADAKEQGKVEWLLNLRNEVDGRYAAKIDRQRHDCAEESTDPAADESADPNREQQRCPDRASGYAAQPQEPKLPALVEQQEVRQMAKDDARSQQQRQG